MGTAAHTHSAGSTWTETPWHELYLFSGHWHCPDGSAGFQQDMPPFSCFSAVKSAQIDFHFRLTSDPEFEVINLSACEVVVLDASSQTEYYCSSAVCLDPHTAQPGYVDQVTKAVLGSTIRPLEVSTCQLQPQRKGNRH